MFKKFFTILFLLALNFEITQPQTLQYSAFTSSTLSTVESWTITNSQTTPVITTCGSNQIIGGYDKFGDSASATQILDLPAHYRIRITLDIYLLDTWDGEFMQVYVDQTKGYEYSHSGIAAPANICGGSSPDQLNTVSFELDHNFRNAFIMITSTLDQQPNDESWGFRNFQLYIYACPSGCLICSNGESYSDCSVWSLAKSLQTSLDLSTFMVSLWTILPGSPTKHSCSIIPVICGPSRCGQGTQIYMTLSLPQHFRIKIRFKYIKLDTWRTGDIAYFQIDGVTKWTQELLLLPQYSQSICGQTAVDLVLNVEFTVSHTATSTYLNLRNNLDEGFTVQAFGFRDFEIFTTMTKETVASNTPIVCGDMVTQGSEDCDDGNLIPFDGCFFCQYSCFDGCLDCLYGECISCYPDWDFDSNNSNCIYQQKNWKYQDFEQQCEDDNLTPFDGCFNYQYSCVYGCKECILGQCVFCEDGFEFNEIYYSCEPICGDFIIKTEEQCDQNSPECVQCKLQCSENCQSCQNGVCLTCQIGYELGTNNQCEKTFEVKISNNLCSLTCKQCQNGVCLDCDNEDQKLVGQCQDLTGETEQTKLCNVYQVGIDQQCEQSFKLDFENNLCPSTCNTCFNGICIECQEGYLNILGQCQQICGDSQLALKTVLECQCDIECSNCKYGICSECNPEFILNNNKCDGICGNGIIQVNEQCDDGNNQEFDGCYNCQYSCSKGCVTCVLGQCLDQCNYGYYPINDNCETVCGDQIVAGNEQCDDGNTDQIDGCFNCLFNCPQYCKYCIEGVCIECQQGLTLINNECLNSCGDGVPFNTEECDDGNLINGDGCSQQCHVEQDWVCQNGTFCLFQKYPQIIAKLQDARDQKQIVSLQFSQQVYQKLYTSYINNIELSIKDLDESLYNIIIIEIQGAQYEKVNEVSYQLEVEFFTPLEYVPTLIIKLKESLYNEYDSPLQSNTATVVLQKPNYISATQKKAAGALQVANESSVKSLFALSFILVIFGDALSFMGILDILQEQSYLRFINVQYPQTILIYFESSKLVSLDTIFEFFSLTSFLDSIQEQFQVEQSYGKFRYYQIDANVMTNFLGEAIIFGSLFVTLLCTTFLIKALDHIQKTHILLKHPKIHKKIQQVQRQIYRIKVEIKKKGVKQTFFASSWDLILISFLQLQFYIHNYAQLNFEVIETSQTYFGIILSFCILGAGFYMISKYIRSVSFTKQRSLFSFWQKKGELFRYLKKFLILYILVFYQDHQEHQTLLLTFINIFYIIYVYTFKPCKTLQDNYKTLAMEISKLMFFASTFTYWDILSNYFLHDDKVTISWVQIGILVSSILVFVIIEFYNLISLIVKKLTLYRQKYKKLPVETTPTSQADSNQLYTFKASQENIENGQTEDLKTIFKRQKILSSRLSKQALRRRF